MDKEPPLKLVNAMGVNGTGKSNAELIQLVKDGADTLQEEKTRTSPINGWRQNAGWRGPSNFIAARRLAPRQFVQRYQSQVQPRQANFEMQNNFNRDRMNDSNKLNTTANQFEQRPKNE